MVGILHGTIAAGDMALGMVLMVLGALRGDGTTLGIRLIIMVDGDGMIFGTMAVCMPDGAILTAAIGATGTIPAIEVCMR